MVWRKGYRELVDLLAKHKVELDDFHVDVYGNGENSSDIRSTATKLKLNMQFHQGRDHADNSRHGCKVFINPIINDVLCTATVEALPCSREQLSSDGEMVPVSPVLQASNSLRLYKLPNSPGITPPRSLLRLI